MCMCGSKCAVVSDAGAEKLCGEHVLICTTFQLSFFSTRDAQQHTECLFHPCTAKCKQAERMVTQILIIKEKPTTANKQAFSGKHCQ